MTPFLHQPKGREKDFKDEEKETELAVPPKQQSKERRDWQGGKSETGPDEQHRQKNKGKRVCNVDVIG